MPKRVLQGTVVSDKADKTIIVRVERSIIHPIYKKYIRRSKRYMAHDETNSCKLGQAVKIIECRPLSARKRWQVLTDDAVPTIAPAMAGGDGTAAAAEA